MAPSKKQNPVGLAIPRASTSASSTIEPSSPLGTLATDPLPIVKVNTANLNEIKAALDEIVKQYLADQSFTPSNVNPSIHLALGYSSVLLSLGGMLYSLRVSFEESKPVLWASVVGYFMLQTALWAWKRWVEGGEVFRGKRRRVIKRIETDQIRAVTTTSLDPPAPQQITYSPHNRPSSSPSSPRSVSSAELSPSASTDAIPALPQISPRLPSISSSSPLGEKPSYILRLELSTTSNNGKSLIHKARVVSGRGVGQFVDSDGGVEEGEVRRWVAGVLSDAGLVGAEDEGVKAE